MAGFCRKTNDFDVNLCIVIKPFQTVPRCVLVRDKHYYFSGLTCLWMKVITCPIASLIVSLSIEPFSVTWILFKREHQSRFVSQLNDSSGHEKCFPWKGSSHFDVIVFYRGNWRKRARILDAEAALPAKICFRWPLNTIHLPPWCGVADVNVRISLPNSASTLVSSQFYSTSEPLKCPGAFLYLQENVFKCSNMGDILCS